MVAPQDGQVDACWFFFKAWRPPVRPAYYGNDIRPKPAVKKRLLIMRIGISTSVSRILGRWGPSSGCCLARRVMCADEFGDSRVPGYLSVDTGVSRAAARGRCMKRWKRMQMIERLCSLVISPPRMSPFELLGRHRTDEIPAMILGCRASFTATLSSLSKSNTPISSKPFVCIWKSTFSTYSYAQVKDSEGAYTCLSLHPPCITFERSLRRRTPRQTVDLPHPHRPWSST